LEYHARGIATQGCHDVTHKVAIGVEEGLVRLGAVQLSNEFVLVLERFLPRLGQLVAAMLVRENECRAYWWAFIHGRLMKALHRLGPAVPRLQEFANGCLNLV